MHNDYKKKHIANVNTDFYKNDYFLHKNRSRVTNITERRK